MTKRSRAATRTAGPDECRRDSLFRYSTSFHTAGLHRLVASYPTGDSDRSTSLTVEVRAASIGPGPTPPAIDRGFLDPDRASHSVFGGVAWSVGGQRVVVAAPPAGSTTAVAACMQLYGASIIKQADAAKVSRGSVVATAITESSCSNPAGSSDGLSSGPMQVTGSTCASVVTGYTSAACKAKMHSDPDFSFLVGAKYMGSSYQIAQHAHDPPKIAAAYNAGSVRSSTANRWHMIVTGNHIERWVGAYNAYREWETMTGAAKTALAATVATRAIPIFEGEHAASFDALPASAREGQVLFVGDWTRRDGAFVTFRDGAWQAD